MSDELLLGSLRRYDGAVVLVTGGGAGIGRAVCERFAAEGAHVAVLDRDESGALDAADRCRALAGNALALICDVRDGEALRAAHEQLVSGLGEPRVLINNCGGSRESTLAESIDADWQASFELNLLSAVRCSRLVLGSMSSARGGAIINVASLHALAGVPGWGPYATAKGGLIAFTRQLAVETAADGVRVNCVVPGTILTKQNEERLAAAADRSALVQEWASAIPMGRLGTPEEVAAVVAFLASDDARFMTGAVVVADGGQSARL